MRRDVHLQALKAASNVAFAVALVGCGGAQDGASTQGDNASADDGTPGVAAEADLHGKPKPKPKASPKTGDKTSASSSCHDGEALPADCQAVVDAAFPTDGAYPGTKQDVSSQVSACCADLLTKSSGMMASHRWDCCANVTTKDPNVSMACTPWGPPVPPAMKRRAMREVA